MIFMEIKSADPSKKNAVQKITLFSSYSFDRSLLTPAAAFRFTAPGVNKADRLAIRSGDQVTLYCNNDLGHTASVGVGFIDETDTHITAHAVEYVLTGRDPIGQLIDNDVLDKDNQVIFFERATINSIVTGLIKNTRMSQVFNNSQLDSGRTFAFHTDPSETKISTLQRILSWCNGLVWADYRGRLTVGKPDFNQEPKGTLAIQPSINYSNVLEARVRRNVNQAIRQITTVLNGTEASATTVAASTLQNIDETVRKYKNTVGRSVSRTFAYAQGQDSINQGQGVGNGSYAPKTLANEYSAREIAMENMKILDVEIVVEGHFNEQKDIYDINQIYTVIIEDENVSEAMMVYNVSYELTMDHGMITRMRLCRLHTITAYAAQIPKTVKS